MKKEQEETQEMLELYRATMDRNVFYEEIYKWDYAGIKPYVPGKDVSIIAYNALLKKYGEQLGEDCKFRVYLSGDKCYFVQNKKINYANFEKNPLKFYDDILNGELMMAKAHVKNKKKNDGSDDITITETTQKRHIGARVDLVKETIEKACLKKADVIIPTVSES